MTEKQYGGQTGREGNVLGGNEISIPKIIKPVEKTKELAIKKVISEKETLENRKADFEKANQIAHEIKHFAKSFIQKGMPLLEIAEKIEDKIFELGGKPAFPTNLSINEIAAHYTPAYDDKRVADGLLKVDFGVQINGWTSDNAFSLDLEDSEENKKLIESAEKALENASKIFDKEHSFGEIGKIISETISLHGFQPVINLSGHQIEQYELHAGKTIPNIDNHDERKIKSGLYAIEPFSTKGIGKIQDGRPSGIYQIINDKNPRSGTAREHLKYIIKEYNTLPFCSRWLYKQLGARVLFSLRELEINGNIHHFAQLVEESKSKVAQAEKTIWVD